MYTPLVAATLTLGASLFGMADKRAARHPVRDTIYALGRRNRARRLAFTPTTYSSGQAACPGSICFMRRRSARRWHWRLPACSAAAPSGCATRRIGGARQYFGLPAGRMLAGVSAAGLAGTVGEAGLLHFRGAFHNPFMVAAGDACRRSQPCCSARRAFPAPAINRIWHAGGFASPRCSDLPVSAFMPMAFHAPWVAGATGARMCSTVRPCRHRRASPDWRLPGSPRSLSSRTETNG